MCYQGFLNTNGSTLQMKTRRSFPRNLKLVTDRAGGCLEPVMSKKAATQPQHVQHQHSISMKWKLSVATFLIFHFCIQSFAYSIFFLQKISSNSLPLSMKISSQGVFLVPSMTNEYVSASECLSEYLVLHVGVTCQSVRCLGHF